LVILKLLEISFYIHNLGFTKYYTKIKIFFIQNIFYKTFLPTNVSKNYVISDSLLLMEIRRTEVNPCLVHFPKIQNISKVFF